MAEPLLKWLGALTEGNSGPNPKVFFKDARPSGVDKGKKLVEEPSLSQEAYSSSDALAFKSLKKRTRELFEEVQEESEPSVEMLGFFTPLSMIITQPSHEDLSME